MNEDKRFIYLFWFCCGVFLISFGAMLCLIFIEVPEKNREMASNAQGFLQGTLMSSAVGFLLTGNIVANGKKKEALGTTTATLNAEFTTTPPDQTDADKAPTE